MSLFFLYLVLQKMDQMNIPTSHTPDQIHITCTTSNPLRSTSIARFVNPCLINNAASFLLQLYIQTTLFLLDLYLIASPSSILVRRRNHLSDFALSFCHRLVQTMSLMFLETYEYVFDMPLHCPDIICFLLHICPFRHQRCNQIEHYLSQGPTSPSRPRWKPVCKCPQPSEGST